MVRESLRCVIVQLQATLLSVHVYVYRNSHNGMNVSGVSRIGELETRGTMSAYARLKSFWLGCQF